MPIAIIYVVLVVTFPFWAPLPTQAALSGPSARALANGLDLPPGFQDRELKELGNQQFSSINTLIEDGWARTVAHPNGEEITVLVFRTGTTQSASEASGLLIQYLIDDEMERVPDLLRRTRRGFQRIDGVDYPMYSWHEADATVLVGDVRGGSLESTDELVASLQHQVSEAGLSAPYIGSQRRMVVLAGVAGAAIVTGLLLLRNLVARLRGSRKTGGVAPWGATIVTSDSVAARRNGTALDVIQVGILALVGMASAVGLLWGEAGASIFLASAALAPAVVILLAGGFGAFARKISGRRIHRPRPRRLQWIGVAVISVGVLCTALFSLITLPGAALLVGEVYEVPSGFDIELATQFWFVHVLGAIAYASIALVSVYLTTLLLRLASWTLAARPAEDGWDEAVDRAPGTLLLRPFHEDRKRVPATPSLRRGLMEAWTLRATDRLEEILCWELSKRGPVDAVGKPGSSRRRLGAVRVALQDEDWQAAVWRRMHEAPLIVAILGRSDGFSWELNALFQAGAIDRTVLLVAPGSARDRESAWQTFLSVSIPHLAGPRPSPQAGATLAVTINDGIVHQYAADRTDEAAYRVALRSALRDLDRAREASGELVEPTGVGR